MNMTKSNKILLSVIAIMALLIPASAEARGSKRIDPDVQNLIDDLQSQVDALDARVTALENAGTTTTTTQPSTTTTTEVPATTTTQPTTTTTTEVTTTTTTPPVEGAFPTEATTGHTGPLTPGTIDGPGLYENQVFTGPIKVYPKDGEFYHFKNCKFQHGNENPANRYQGLIFSDFSVGAATFIFEDCTFDKGFDDSAYIASVGIYQPSKIIMRRNHIYGGGDGIKPQSDGLYEDNLIEVTGSTPDSPGHIDGIHGGYFKVNWTARHNTIIGGVVPTDEALASGASNDRGENGANICIWGPLDGADYNYGVLAENNYCDGFNTGISLQGTDANNPHIVRNNTFGKNFRFYPALRIRTWSEYPHTVVEDNQNYDLKLDETTGTVGPY